MNSGHTLTKIDLKAFNLSDYTVKQLLEGLNALSITNGLKGYDRFDLKVSVEKRLLNSRVKIKNKAKLKRLLAYLNGESNIIEVDFLTRLSSDEKIEVLHSRIQDLEIQEQHLIEETKRLLKESRRMVARS